MAAVLVAALGTAAMAAFALGLWLPAYLRYRAIQRRLMGFVNVGHLGGFAPELGGRRRVRAIRRRAQSEGGQFAVRFLAGRVARAQSDVTVGEVIGAMAVLGLVAFTLVAVRTGTVLLGVPAALIGSWVPIAWLDRRRRKITSQFNNQIPETLSLLSSSVSSGHSLVQALEHVAGEGIEPTRSAFALVVREIGIGASQEDALERLADRYPSDDIDLLVSATNVHQQIGGSLTKILDTIGETIRARMEVAAEIRSLTAQQRYSAYVLSLLPVAAGGALLLFSPGYVAPLFEAGPMRIVLLAAAGLAISGFFVMRLVGRVDA